MPLAFKKGDRVRQKVIVITGEVSDVKLVDGEPQFEVAYTDADGVAHARFFAEDAIEAAPAPAEEPAL